MPVAHLIWIIIFCWDITEWAIYCNPGQPSQHKMTFCCIQSFKTNFYMKSLHRAENLHGTKHWKWQNTVGSDKTLLHCRVPAHWLLLWLPAADWQPYVIVTCSFHSNGHGRNASFSAENPDSGFHWKTRHCLWGCVTHCYHWLCAQHAAPKHLHNASRDDSDSVSGCKSSKNREELKLHDACQMMIATKGTTQKKCSWCIEGKSKTKHPYSLGGRGHMNSH